MTQAKMTMMQKISMLILVIKRKKMKVESGDQIDLSMIEAEEETEMESSIWAPEKDLM